MCMSAWFWFFFGFDMNFLLKMVVELNVVIGSLVFVYDDDNNKEGTGMMMKMINK